MHQERAVAKQSQKVIILEMLGRIGADIERTNRWVIISRLHHLGVRIERNAKVVEITDEGARISRNGGTEFFRGDSVILAVGMKPSRKLAQDLEGKIAELFIIGDSDKPGKIAHAIESGFRTVQAL
ncbi:MAG TPA: hypothetical protein EYP71_05965 [Dehalococcoidia bacterium]|nr:hypothetical protein [Dehalococcoidia bacterium]